jgi:hypothetical protein
MRHLTPEELIDLAEGARAPASAPHLQRCAACREALAGLRTMLAIAADNEVPEPSPLFWDHFSANVQTAVAAEVGPDGTSGRSGLSWFGGLWARWTSLPETGPRGVAAAGAAVALLLVVVVLAIGLGWRGDGAGASRTVASDAAGAPMSELQNDDPSLAVMLELTRDMDLDTASDAGLATHVGGADGVISQLTAPERRELDRLLKEALAKPGP